MYSSLLPGKNIIWCSDSPGWGGAEMSLLRMLGFVPQFHAQSFAVLSPEADSRLTAGFAACGIPVTRFFAPAGIGGIHTALAQAMRLRRNHSDAVYVFWSHHVDSNRWLKWWLCLMG